MDEVRTQCNSQSEMLHTHTHTQVFAATHTSYNLLLPTLCSRPSLVLFIEIQSSQQLHHESSSNRFANLPAERKQRTGSAERGCQRLVTLALVSLEEVVKGKLRMTLTVFPMVKKKERSINSNCLNVIAFRTNTNSKRKKKVL